MADDHQQQSLLVNHDASIPDDLSQIDSLENAFTEKNLKAVSSTDILQQALHEADGYTHVSTFSNTQNSILHENIHPLSDHSYIHSSNSNNILSSCDINSQDADSSDIGAKQENDCKELRLPSISLEATTNVSDLNTSQILKTPSFTEEDNKLCLNGDVLSFSSISDSTNIDVFTDTSAVISPVSTNSTLSCDGTVIESPVTESFSPLFIIKTAESHTVPSSLSSPSTSHDVTSVKVPVKQTNAPLGSVENPIQIIQNGNSYHATQILTQAQLQQISHVLQKQQAKKALESKGKSVLYDPSTNTRIVCRIVHPSELQSQSSQDSSIESTSKEVTARSPNSFRGRGRPRKQLQSRKSKDDEKASIVLTKEERDEKKKHRPRTRSGRISKPPSYMVKDYKRIHHLDFNEEPYDDSDGGYSDYHVSDEEAGKWAPKANSLPPGVTTAKQRNYSCQSCSKAYIGRGGLSRHYRTHPSHGSMPEGEDVSTQDENSNSSLASSVLSNSGCNTSSQTFSCNINSQASSSSSSNQASAFIPQAELKAVSEGPSPVQAAAVNPNIVASNRRKARLREVLKNYQDEDILDVLLPKFAQDVSLWDFFVAKCTKDSEGLSIFEMLKEFEKFISFMQTESLNCLSPVNLQDVQGKTIINISSKQIAAALSLETGPYMVKTSLIEPEMQSPTKVFRLNNNASDILGITEDSPAFKRKRLDASVEDVTSGLPEQILSDVIPESDSLELQLTEENLSNSAELQNHDVHVLSSSICNPDNHDIVSKGLFDLNSSTIVTPSSLSSGCLSAVNASRTPSSNLLTPRTSPKMPNIQIRKLQLFSSQQQQVLPQNDVTISVPVSDLSVSADCNINDLSSASQMINKEPVIVQKQIDVCNSTNIASKTFQGLPLDSSVDIFNSSIQELPAQAVVLDSNVEPNNTVSSVSLINTADIHNQNVPSDTIQTASVQTELAESIANCLPESHIACSLGNSSGIVTTGLQALVPSEVNISTNVTEEARDFGTTHNVISEVSKLPESSAFLSHVMLPDGQVLSIWSPMENTEKVQSEQFVQSYVPGNLIILQNPDGSIQVPNNQGVPAETLQTIASLNQGISSEAGTHAFTSVRPM